MDMRNKPYSTCHKKQPLQVLAVALHIRDVRGELMVAIEGLREVSQNRRRLEHGETVVGDCWDFAIRVDLA